MKLYNRVKELIIEAVATSPIVNAIKNKHVCELSYRDDSSIGPGKRVIQPVALGTSKKGNKVLRAYQTEGPSLKVNKEGTGGIMVCPVFFKNENFSDVFSPPVATITASNG